MSNLYLLQYDIAWQDAARNQQKIEALLASQQIEAQSLVVLPEMAFSGFGRDVSKIADHDASLRRWLSSLAVRFQCYLLAGIVLSENGKGRNVYYGVSPSGDTVASYVKQHSFSFAGEHEAFLQGNSLSLFQWQGFQVCPFICYDLRFPEVFREALDQQATLFVVGASWPELRRHHWRSLLVARAIENQAYVVGCNRIGKDPALNYSGDSLIVSPQGALLVDAGAKEGVFSAKLSLEDVNVYRQAFPALNDRKR